VHEAASGADTVPSVREVRSRADRRAYLTLVREPYIGDPYWVHPDVRILKNLLRGKALLTARSEWRALIAKEDGKDVACLTAFVHKSFEEKLGRKIGTIGFFEALRGHERAVDALFHEAEDWLRSRGATRVWGPINGHILYGFGCLENRYSERPVVGTAYNPADYPGHWWRQHYKHAPSFYSYTIDLARQDVREAIERAIANPRIADAPQITLRAADLRAWRREVEIFIDLRNEAFAANWGDTHFSHAEIWELLGSARSTIDPELFWIAEIAGRPVGVVLCMPDLNEAFARTRAEPATLSAAVALFRYARRISRGGLFVIGVLEEARGRGLAGTLAANAMKRMIARGMNEMEYCFVLENNLLSQRVARRFGGQQTKTYLMFEKTF
jgi:ribosomal protein S18 acetylase RimI-like enzyme